VNIGEAAELSGESAKMIRRRGDRRPECPIIEGLAAAISPAAKAPAAGILVAEHFRTVAVSSRVSKKAAVSETTPARKRRRTK
jgi:hypothetical protein